MSAAAVDPRVERTRSLVLRAAAELLAEEGFGRITIDGVAERSGVARSTIYRNFPDRPSLMAEAFSHLLDFDELPDTGSLVQDLRSFAHQLVEGLNGGAWGRAVGSLVGSASHDPEMRQALDRFSDGRRRVLRRVFEQAMARGEIASGAPVDAAQVRFVGPFFFLHLFKSGSLDEAFIETMVAATVEEVGASDAA